jgi:hypothetical protein
MQDLNYFNTAVCMIDLQCWILLSLSFAKLLVPMLFVKVCDLIFICFVVTVTFLLSF